MSPLCFLGLNSWSVVYYQGEASLPPQSGCPQIVLDCDVTKHDAHAQEEGGCWCTLKVSGLQCMASGDIRWVHRRECRSQLRLGRWLGGKSVYYEIKKTQVQILSFYEKARQLQHLWGWGKNRWIPGACWSTGLKSGRTRFHFSERPCFKTRSTER